MSGPHASPASGPAPGPPAPAQRFVVSGLSRLTLRVAGLLADRGSVAVLATPDERSLGPALPAEVALVELREDLEGALRGAGLEGAACLLALGDDDLANLRVAVAAGAVAPAVPIVLRAFDPALAEEMAGRLNLRRAYSVSQLSAPALVIAALDGDPLDTLRLGETQVPLARLGVGASSPLGGATPSEAAKQGLTVLAVRDPRAAWELAGEDRVIAPNAEVLVGGTMEDVLTAARAGAPQGRERRARRGSGRSRPDPAPAALPRAVVGSLIVLLLATIVVYGIALDIGPVDALYFAITTAFGNPTLDESQQWLKVFGVTSMILGGILVGILFSYVTSLATAVRLEERMAKRAARLSGHAVIAGLGTAGYRVERLLFDLGVKTAAIERSPDARFIEAVVERTPVVAGDIRLRENLERAGVDGAWCLFATTDDDLANIEACVQARRIAPGIRTVARVFDATLAERASEAFGIDGVISTTAVAAKAFVSAALDERAMRHISLDGLALAAVRFDIDRAVDPGELARWREWGVRVIAHRGGDAEPRAGWPSEGLAPGDAVAIAGPEEAVVATVLASVRPTAGG